MTHPRVTELWVDGFDFLYTIFYWTPRHAGSSHQNWARPTEFFSCCTDRLELSSAHLRSTL